MNASEFRKLSLDELEAKLEELSSEFFNLRVKHATGQLEDTAHLGKLRRDIARAQTVKREMHEAQA